MGLDLDQARRQAKELLRAARSGDVLALARLRGDRSPRLADAQAAVARDLGFRSWPALVAGALREAVEDSDLERLQALVAHGASVRGSDLLLHARDPAITALLIEGGARLDVRDANGLTPYSRAARFQSEANEVVARLLDAGVPIDARGRQDGTALHYAGLWGRASTLRLLLARGAEIRSLAGPPEKPGVEDWTAIEWTAWGSLHTTAASDRRAAYRDCAAALITAGAPITDRVPVAHLIDEIRDTELRYLPGTQVRIRVRLRGTRVDVDDMGGAVGVSGTPPGWHAAAERAVAELRWNVRRNGVVFMQAPRGRRLEWIIQRTAEASAAVCSAVLQLGDNDRTV